MGGSKDKYLFRDFSGYQHVDRYACGLKQLEKTFSVSPTYFDYI